MILGIRPESFEDAAFAPGLPTIEVVVEVLEDLGSDAHVFFTVDARSITAEVLEAARRGATPADRRHGALFTARVDARTTARASAQRSSSRSTRGASSSSTRRPGAARFRRRGAGRGRAERRPR